MNDKDIKKAVYREIDSMSNQIEEDIFSTTPNLGDQNKIAYADDINDLMPTLDLNGPDTEVQGAGLKLDTTVNISDVVEKVPDIFWESGTSGLNRYGNFVYEEFLTNLRYPQAAKVYQEMSDNDATIGAILYLAEQLIKKSDWYVQPASDSEEDIVTATFVEECMHDMSQSWADTICEALSMFTYGWSFHEVIYKIRKGPTQKDGKYRSKYNDNKIGWRNMPSRSQHTLYGWEFAQDGGATAMIQWSPPDFKMIRIPFAKGLLFRTKTNKSNPEGKSLLRNAYRPWYFKKRIEEIEGIGLERDLAGLPLLIPPDSVDIWDKNNPEARILLSRANSLVKNVRRDSSEGLVIPHGWEFKLMSTGGTRQFDTNAIINRYDQRIAMSMLSDIIMLGSGRTGSFALADAKKSLLSASLEAQIQNIADVFNKYAIPPLMEMNGIKCPNGYPKIMPDSIEAPNMDEIGKIFKSSGLKWDTDLDIYNLLREYLEIKPVDLETFEATRDNAREAEMRRQESYMTPKENINEDNNKEDEI